MFCKSCEENLLNQFSSFACFSHCTFPHIFTAFSHNSFLSLLPLAYEKKKPRKSFIFHFSFALLFVELWVHGTTDGSNLIKTFTFLLSTLPPSSFLRFIIFYVYLCTCIIISIAAAAAARRWLLLKSKKKRERWKSFYPLEAQSGWFEEGVVKQRVREAR